MQGQSAQEIFLHETFRCIPNRAYMKNQATSEWFNNENRKTLNFWKMTGRVAPAKSFALDRNEQKQTTAYWSKIEFRIFASRSKLVEDFQCASNEITVLRG